MTRPAVPGTRGQEGRKAQLPGQLTDRSLSDVLGVDEADFRARLRLSLDRIRDAERGRCHGCSGLPSPLHEPACDGPA